MTLQKGGQTIGNGGYNIIKTLNSISSSRLYYVDTYDILNGVIETTIIDSRSKLLKEYGNKIIIRELNMNDGPSLIDISSFPDGPNQSSEYVGSCFVKLLYNHWKKYQLINIAFIDNLVKYIPEWNMLWLIYQRGIIYQHHSIDHFTTFYTKPSNPHIVTICIRTDNLVIPVYKRFNGDITRNIFIKHVNLKNIFDMVENLLLTLTYFMMYDFHHHFDIKPKNILFKKSRETKGGYIITTRLGDYDGIFSIYSDINSDIHINDIRVIITHGYSSPFNYDNETDFLNSFRSLPHVVHKFVNGKTIWQSWQTLINQHVKPYNVRDKKKCSIVDKVMVKNDIYAIGATILSFSYNINKNNKGLVKKMNGLYDYAISLMMGSKTDIKYFTRDNKLINSIDSIVDENNSHQYGLMNLSEAAIKLNDLRKTFTEEDVHNIKISM